MKTILFIDGHALIHRAFHALPPLSAPDGRPVQALYGLSTILLRIFREMKPDYIAAFLDRPETTFRQEEYGEYKAQRPKAADELVSQIIEARTLFSKFGVATFELPGFEADDLIATATERFGRKKDLQIVIVTGDLDALQLVEGDAIIVEALKTGIRDTVRYNEAAVLARYGIQPAILPDYKALAGDPSDNIPGVPGVGPKTASTLLQKYGSLEEILSHLDQEPKIKEKFIKERENIFLYRRLATMRRDAPLDLPPIETMRLPTFSSDLSEYFQTLGFQSLVARLRGSAAGNGAPGRRAQPEATGLFESATITPSDISRDAIYILDNALALKEEKKIKSTLVKVGVNIKEFLKQAHEAGITVAGPLADIGIGLWLLEPDLRRYDREAIGRRLLKHATIEGENDFAAAYSVLRQNLNKNGLSRVFTEIEMPLVPVLARMEIVGIGVDRAALESLRGDIVQEINTHEEKIRILAGEAINPNSPKQLSRLLFQVLRLPIPPRAKTKSGQISTKSDVLDGLRGKHEIIEHLINYRESFKILSTYIDPILKLSAEDGRLHTDFIQTGTATGRLSSREPNMQNIPSSAGGASWGGRLRSVLVPSATRRFLAFDYSQLELRIVASLSNDRVMMSAFKRGEDIHSATAASIFHVARAEVTKEMRRIAKTLNFGVLYGMGADAFAATAKVSRDEARIFIKEYFQTFSGVAKWQEEMREEGRTTGFVRNMNGRLRSVQGINFGKSRIASEMERVAINMPVQSLEADIIKLAMIGVEKWLSAEAGRAARVAMLLTIHDELLLEAAHDIIDETAREVQKIMESAFSLAVPLVVNVKTGNNLADLEAWQAQKLS